MKQSLALLVLLAAPALATGFPPVVTKSFSPSIVAVNQIATVTITLTNPNAFTLPGASISDTFPAGLVNAGPFPGTASTTCPGGFVGTTPSSLMMVGGTIPASGSCTITAPVLCATPGSYQNDTGSLFTGSGTSLGGGSATLIVVPAGQLPALSRTAMLLLITVLAVAALSRLGR